MKLISEIFENVEYIAEGKEDGPKAYYIKGPFLSANLQNKNGRIYPKAVLEKAVNNYMSLINEKRALGELGHPPTPTVNYDRVSHLITELSFQGDYVYGKAKILTEMPCGKIAKALLDEGIKIGVSSRGLGSLKPRKDGLMEVQDDYKIATVDLVSEPSGVNCWTEGIMESADWVYGTNGWQQVVAEKCKQTIKKTPKKNLEEVKLRLFENYLKII